MKTQYFSPVLRTSENADIFTSRDEIYLVFTRKKVKKKKKFILQGELQKAKCKFFPGCFSSSLTVSVCFLGITMGVNKVST